MFIDNAQTTALKQCAQSPPPHRLPHVLALRLTGRFQLLSIQLRRARTRSNRDLSFWPHFRASPPLHRERILITVPLERDLVTVLQLRLNSTLRHVCGQFSGNSTRHSASHHRTTTHQRPS